MTTSSEHDAHPEPAGPEPAGPEPAEPEPAEPRSAMSKVRSVIAVLLWITAFVLVVLSLDSCVEAERLSHERGGFLNRADLTQLEGIAYGISALLSVGFGFLVRP